MFDWNKENGYSRQVKGFQSFQNCPIIIQLDDI